MRFEKVIVKFIDNTRLKNLIFLWVLFNVFFACIYWYAAETTEFHYLTFNNQPIPSDFQGFLDSIYFSFVTSTTLGYGDIVPMGILRYISAFQAATGLLMLTFIISRLVSKKQEQMIRQMHATSFDHEARSLRSGMYIFREKMDHLIHQVKKNSIKQREIAEDLNLRLISFYTHVSEILATQEKKHHLNELEDEKFLLHIAMSLNSVIKCFKAIIAGKKRLKSREIEFSLELLEKRIMDTCDLIKKRSHLESRNKLITRIINRMHQIQEMSKEFLIEEKKDTIEEEE